MRKSLPPCQTSVWALSIGAVGVEGVEGVGVVISVVYLFGQIYSLGPTLQQGPAGSRTNPERGRHRGRRTVPESGGR